MEVDPKDVMREWVSIQKHPEFGKVQLDLSDESSSSTDNSFDDEDFEVENSYHSDGTESCSQIVRRREVPIRKRPLRNHDANAETNAVPKPTPGDQYQTSLPLRFRFEDEVSKQVAKTDYEKEIEDMHVTLEFCWTLEEQDSFNYSEVDQEPEKSPVTETQDARCAKGLHEFIIREDAGVICKYSLLEEVGPKDVIPEWEPDSTLFINCHGHSLLVWRFSYFKFQ